MPSSPRLLLAPLAAISRPTPALADQSLDRHLAWPLKPMAVEVPTGPQAPCLLRQPQKQLSLDELPLVHPAAIEMRGNGSRFRPSNNAESAMDLGAFPDMDPSLGSCATRALTAESALGPSDSDTTSDMSRVACTCCSAASFVMRSADSLMSRALLKISAPFSTRDRVDATAAVQSPPEWEGERKGCVMISIN